MPIGCRATCPGYIAAGSTQEVVPCPSPPPPPPSPTTTTTPAPMNANKTIVLTLTASGSVSDYSDTTALRRSIAASAGVAPSSTVITVAPASVIITATITVPASTADAAKTALSSILGTAAAASAALGIDVESVPTVTISSSAPKAVTDAGASNVEGDSDSSPIGAIIGALGEQNAPRCAHAARTAVRDLAELAPLAPPAHTVGGVAVVALVGAGVYYVKMRARTPPASAGGGQAQGGVTLSAPDESKI